MSSTISPSDDVDAMGVRHWYEADQCKQDVVEVLMAALLRGIAKTGAGEI